jgi:uncharacterized Zn ribbon protein
MSEGKETKCYKCNSELFYKPKNKLSIAMCLECYYNFKNKPKAKVQDLFGTMPMNNLTDVEFNKIIKEL